MPINHNDSTKVVVQGAIRYTGLANMRVLGVNPTLEELKRINPRTTTDKEPEYLKTDIADNESYTNHRLDFLVFNLEHKYGNKVTIWLQSRIRKSLKGDKIQWINKFGQTAWTTGIDTPPVPNDRGWPNLEGMRPALVGEEDLTKFITAFCNTQSDQQGVFDNPELIAKGDLTEIKELLKVTKGNEVTVLNGIRKVEDKNTGKINYFPSTYTRYFGRPSVKDFTKWTSELESEYGAWKDDYQNDLHFKRYEGSTTTSVTKPTNLNGTGNAPPADYQPAGASPGMDLDF